MSESDTQRLFTRMFVTQLLAFACSALPFAYVLGLVLELPAGEAFRVHAINGTLLPVVFGVVLPNLILRAGLRSAMVQDGSEAPGVRLARILRLPRRLEMMLLASYLTGVAIYVGWPMLSPSLGVKPIALAEALVCFTMLALLTSIPQMVVFERILHPLALEEFHKNPAAQPEGGGFLWPRLSWYLPYAFAIFVLSTLVTAGTVIGKLTSSVIGEQMAQGGATAQVLERSLATSLVLPLVLLCAYLMAVAAFAAWTLARHLRNGAEAVQTAIVSLASGKPVLPGWVTTDELGDLARKSAGALDQLKSFTLALAESAKQLGKSAEELDVSNSKQNEVLSLQAAALQQTQVTAQEIKQTSLLAAQKAEGVLAQTERADEISRSGESAIEQSLSGLKDIQQQVNDMSTRIKALDERARQIANITTTVKDLADQSNMLALNAAIEAVRSGEHGKGFGVVAREIRNLADQSIQATNHVREILQDISEAIRTTVSITEKGSEKVDSSLAQVRAFGDNIRQLSGIVRDNAAAVRQISAAVTQQNAGIGQIFQAVNDLTKMMDDTMQRLRSTDGATSLVRSVAEQVSGLVGNYGWQDVGNNPSAAPENKA
ncbi:MAG TPA: methyl-accepting chemotaxis protein [Myxococcaceae bacterium]|nr:methyl-accepting chemotaxis protein [Myxococcaceae bacterium]